MNDPDRAVEEALRGLAAAHGDLVRVDFERSIVLRRDAPLAGKVGVVSGGGSGHEPMHSGYVGRGMLDAACIGEVFTAPVPAAILAATEAVDGGAGVVHLVKNYTGDILNFELAAELAAERGILTECVVIGDDVALGDTTAIAGRRATGATPLVEKIAGAAAARGLALAEVAEAARRAVVSARSYGVALSSCSTPARGEPTFVIEPGEMEFGIGIHGERGRRRASIMTAAEIVEAMVGVLLADFGAPTGADVLAVVNGLGATPLMELYIVYGELAERLAEYGLNVTRCLVGEYVTTLDMAGLSITLLHLDAELTELWDEPVRTVGFRWGA
jgi:dihydroxyacetone kinase-like protein